MWSDVYISLCVCDFSEVNMKLKMHGKTNSTFRIYLGPLTNSAAHLLLMTETLLTELIAIWERSRGR